MYEECDSTRKVWLLHAECNFYTHKRDFYTQSAISTRRVWFYTQSMISTHTSVMLTRVRVNMTLMSVIYIQEYFWIFEKNQEF
jgi:hypothetical protein